MVKILLVENAKNHQGELFQGFANENGKDIVFLNVKSAIEWMIKNSEFIAEFNHSKIVNA